MPPGDRRIQSPTRPSSVKTPNVVSGVLFRACCCQRLLRVQAMRWSIGSWARQGARRHSGKSSTASVRWVGLARRRGDSQGLAAELPPGGDKGFGIDGLPSSSERIVDDERG